MSSSMDMELGRILSQRQKQRQALQQMHSMVGTTLERRAARVTTREEKVARDTSPEETVARDTTLEHQGVAMGACRQDIFPYSQADLQIPTHPYRREGTVDRGTTPGVMVVRATTLEAMGVKVTTLEGAVVKATTLEGMVDKATTLEAGREDKDTTLGEMEVISTSRTVGS